MQVLKREPIRARLPEGRGVVSEPRTAEERRRLACEARRALEQMKAALEMAENYAERLTEAAWAKDWADQRTPEEQACDGEEAVAVAIVVRGENGGAPSTTRPCL